LPGRFRDRLSAAACDDLPARPVLAGSGAVENADPTVRFRASLPVAAHNQRRVPAGPANDGIRCEAEATPPLPRDIAVLAELGRDPFVRFEWPAWLATRARAHGLEAPKFPCQVSAGAVTRWAAGQELCARLRELDGLPGRFKGSFHDRVMTVVRCVMVAAAVLNALRGSRALWVNRQDPELVPALAGEAVAAAVHLALYRQLSAVQGQVGRLDRTGLLEALEAGDQVVVGFVQDQLRRMDKDSRLDVLRGLLSALMLFGTTNLAVATFGSLR
jgi:hypothetical protein